MAIAIATTSSEKNQLYIYTPSDERLGVLDLMQTPTAVRWTLRGLSNKVLRTFDSEHITFLAGAVLVQDIQGWSWKKDYVYRSGSLLAAVVPGTSGGEETQHFHLDHLGTPRLKTDANKVVLNRHKYLPYGEELTTPSLDNEVMQFTSHERDRTPTDWDNDLDYMHARYYAPKFGRFLSLDPVGGRAALPQSWNRYSYVVANPVSRIDPNGRQDISYMYLYTGKMAAENGGTPEVFLDPGKQAASALVGMIPGVGDLKDRQEAGTGLDLITGESLSKFERSLSAGAGLIPWVSGKALRTYRRFFGSIEDAVKLKIPTTGRKFNQIERRGWTGSSIQETVQNPHATRNATNRATNNPATAYFNKDGSYVVVDNETGDLVQLSDRANQKSWRPDPSIEDPYVPLLPEE